MEVSTSGKKIAISNPPFRPEILDHMVDNLCDEHETLWSCCLIAKSWVPHARKHLFAHINLFSPERVESWKTFPDPSDSPAHHTHTLSVKCLKVVTAADDSSLFSCCTVGCGRQYAVSRLGICSMGFHIPLRGFYSTRFRGFSISFIPHPCSKTRR